MKKWLCLSWLWLAGACADDPFALGAEEPRDARVFTRADADGGSSRADARSDVPMTANAPDGSRASEPVDASINERDASTSSLRDAANDASMNPGDAALSGDAATADASAVGDGGAAATSKRIVGYYPAWATYARDYQVAEMPASRLTHVNYAFANIEAGKCTLGDPWADVQKTFPGDTWEESSSNKAGNLKQLRKLREQNPALRTLISVGGWTWSAKFSDLALTPESRATFASSCVEFMVQHGFDGIDIDWEYPVGGGLESNVYRPVDKANYTLLLQALRATLDSKQRAIGRSEPYLLTIAAPAGPSLIGNLDVRAIAETVDWINVMSYDFHGAWEKRTGHNAPLRQASGDTLSAFNVGSAIEAYLAAGAPASRLVMGVPFYGRSFAGVSAGATRGLHQPASGAGPGTWENGVLDYHDIRARYLDQNGFVRYEDPSADVPYLFHAASGLFISYDDPASIAKKAAFARTKGLAGTMIWDLSSDSADFALLEALRR